MSELHVRQIETYLREHYSELWDDNLDAPSNLSRLLARFAVDVAIGERALETSTQIEVTDGRGDLGIDAIAVDQGNATVILVQSKWRQDGSGSIDLAGVLKFLRGVRALLDIGDDTATVGSTEIREAVREAMQTPGGRLRMVLATTAANDLADEVRAPILELLNILNDVGEENQIAEHVVLTQSRFFNRLAQPARTPIDLELQMLDWGRTTEPVPAFYGRVSARDVAAWFDEHGSALFAENIRVVLPRSEINEGILRTLRSEPEHFWYYNNGITILAREIERSLGGAANRDAGFFRAVDASVVNGAQTVSTLGRALKAGEEEHLAQAYVSVRCIEVPGEAGDLGRRITRFANTQNVVSSQDFVFLDEEQHRLAKELRLLGYEYLLRSGEVPTVTDRAKVIDVREAAVALACASPDLGHAVLAKREVSRLFYRDSGPYGALFNPNVNGLLLVRAVEVQRVVDRSLAPLARGAQGVTAGVAIHGNRVIAHVLLNRMGQKNLLDSDFDFVDASSGLQTETLKLLAVLAAAFPPNSYPGNVFKNQERCRQLLGAIQAT